MSLTQQFLSVPVVDLKAPDFRDRLKEELSLSTFVKVNGMLGFLASLAVLALGTWMTAGFLMDPHRDKLLGTCIAATVGAGAFVVLRNLIASWRQRNSYKKLLDSPESWELQDAVTTRVSKLALPTMGSDEKALRIFWDGKQPGSASVEIPSISRGQHITIAVRPGSASLVVSIQSAT